MLIGNYSVLAKSPGRELGGVAHSLFPSNQSKAEGWRARANPYTGFQAVSGYPRGYLHPYCLMLPQEGGAIACRQGIAVGASMRAAGELCTYVKNTSNPIGVGCDVTQATGYKAMETGAHLSVGAGISQAAILGSMDITANIGIGVGITAAPIVGAGDIAANIDVGADITQATAEAGVDLTSSIDVGVEVTQATVEAGAALTADIGVGVDVAGDLIGAMNTTASIGVGVDITGSEINAPAFMTSDIPIAVDMSGSMEAPAFMSANIRSYTELTAEGVRDQVWAATGLGDMPAGTAGKMLYSSGGGSDPETIAAAVWAALESTAPCTQGAALTLLRKLGTNRLVEAPGNPGTATLYDDDGVTPIASWSLADVSGAAVTEDPGSVAQRVPR